jgi:hypothetical protein
MAHYYACIRVDRFSDAAVVPEVDVAAADADVGYADEDVVWVGERRDGFVFYFCVVGIVEDDGRVLHSVHGWV